MGVSEEGHAQGRRCREVGSTTTSAQQTQRLKLRRADRAVRRAVARLFGCCASSCGIRPCDRWQRRIGAHITAAAQLRVRVRPVVGLVRIPCCAPLRTHLSIGQPAGARIPAPVSADWSYGQLQAASRCAGGLFVEPVCDPARSPHLQLGYAWHTLDPVACQVVPPVPSP